MLFGEEYNEWCLNDWTTTRQGEMMLMQTSLLSTVPEKKIMNLSMTTSTAWQ